jgi:DNA-binding CsgD family transcriptional regulator
MSWVEDSNGATLSPRQQQILELVANGYSAKEVAGQIGIAPRTVEGHIESIRLKMRARNRAHIVTQAVLAGYLEIGRKPANGGANGHAFDEGCDSAVPDSLPEKRPA